MFKHIKAQFEDCMMTYTDGDVEAAIVSTGNGSVTLVAIWSGDEGDVIEMINQGYSDMREAMRHFAQFISDEYELEV